MDSNLAAEKLRKKQDRLVMDLVKGKEYANQLQAILHKPFGDEGLVLAEELTHKVLKSFTDSLARISSSGMSQIADFDDSKKKPEVTDRRGGYKRRRAAGSWVIVSPTTGDGYAWRKYGQKGILNSKYPRCYFRCTHKYDQGCRAIKQVQKIDQESDMFQTTYFGHHTCRDTMKPSQNISDYDPMETNLLCFAGPSVKHESKEDTQSDLTDNKSSINSSIWQDHLVASGSSMDQLSSKVGSFHEEVVSSVYTSAAATTSLLDLDIKTLSKFADFNNQDFLFDENELL